MPSSTKERTRAGPAPARTMFPAASYCPAAAVPIAPKIPAPMTAPIASMMRSPAPSTRFSECGVSSSLTRSSAIGLRWNSCRTLPPCFRLSRWLVLREGYGRYEVHVTPVSSPRRIEQIAHHPLCEVPSERLILQRRRYLDACDAPIGSHPESHFVFPLGHALWRSDRPPWGGRGNITRIASRASTGIRTDSGSRPRSLPASRSGTLPRSPRCSGPRTDCRRRCHNGDIRSWHLDLHGLGCWNSDGGHRHRWRRRWHLLRLRRRGRRQCKPADGGPATTAASPPRTGAAATAAREHRRATPQNEHGDRYMCEKRERGRGPFAPPRERQGVGVERWTGARGVRHG